MKWRAIKNDKEALSSHLKKIIQENKQVTHNDDLKGSPHEPNDDTIYINKHTGLTDTGEQDNRIPSDGVTKENGSFICANTDQTSPKTGVEVMFLSHSLARKNGI